MRVNVADLKIEAEENGFELHLWLDDWPVCNEDGLVVLNVHHMAERLHDDAVKVIGPWLAEMHAAKAEYDRAGGHPMCPDEDGRCQYGRDEDCPRVDPDRVSWSVALDAADIARKRAKGE
jgi:hypothetical protein